MRNNSPVKPCCDLRRKLAEDFATAARLYAQTVVELAVGGGVSQRQYMRLCKLTEDAQKRSELAFVAYEEHIDWHRCWADTLTQTAAATGRL